MAFLVRGYVGWAARSPFTSQVIVATGKTVAADVLVQTTVEGRSLRDLDGRRVGIFAGFGFLYLGVIQYGLYVKFMQRLFNKAALENFCNAPFRQKIRDVPGLKILAGTIALDFFAIQPFIYWPSYYMVKELGYGSGAVTSESHSGSSPAVADGVNEEKQPPTFASSLVSAL